MTTVPYSDGGFTIRFTRPTDGTIEVFISSLATNLDETHTLAYIPDGSGTSMTLGVSNPVPQPPTFGETRLLELVAHHPGAQDDPTGQAEQLRRLAATADLDPEAVTARRQLIPPADVRGCPADGQHLFSVAQTRRRRTGLRNHRRRARRRAGERPPRADPTSPPAATWTSRSWCGAKLPEGRGAIREDTGVLGQAP